MIYIEAITNVLTKYPKFIDKLLGTDQQSKDLMKQMIESLDSNSEDNSEWEWDLNNY